MSGGANSEKVGNDFLGSQVRDADHLEKHGKRMNALFNSFIERVMATPDLKRKLPKSLRNEAKLKKVASLISDSLPEMTERTDRLTEVKQHLPDKIKTTFKKRQVEKFWSKLTKVVGKRNVRFMKKMASEIQKPQQ